MRYCHIDIAKGLGILAVVGLHTGFHVEAWIGWEMPLFFFLSGVFANPHKQGFLRSKVNRLIVPLCFFYFPIFVYNILYYLMHIDSISLYDSFVNCSIPSALWFLVALFYMSVLHIVIAKFINKHFLLLVVSIVAFSIGYLLSYWHIPQFAFINTSITSFSFYLLGNIFSTEVKGICGFNPYIALLVGIILLIGAQILYDINDSYIFYRNNELNAYIYIVIIVAVLGIVGVLFMSIALSYTKYMSVILSFFGKNSLIILCTHLYCWKLLQPFHFSGFLQFGIVTVSMIPIIYLLRRFFPRLSGCKPLIIS